MFQKNYQQINYDMCGTKVILEFPTESQDAEKIQREVKEILTGELQRRVRKEYEAYEAGKNAIAGEF